MKKKKIAAAVTNNSKASDEIPTGISIESASYIENNKEVSHSTPSNQNDNLIKNDTVEEYTPKLFSDDKILDDTDQTEFSEDGSTEQLFDQDTTEDEDFEIPAFLRRQKF